MTHLIDSDWLIDVFHGQQQATATLTTLAPGGLCISIVTYGELYEGAYYSRNPQGAIAQLQAFIAPVTILPLTGPITERFGIVRGSLPRNVRQQVGDMDLLIAATALHHGLTLVTRNVKDFGLVPGVAIYQP